MSSGRDQTELVGVPLPGSPVAVEVHQAVPVGPSARTDTRSESKHILGSEQQCDGSVDDANEKGESHQLSGLSWYVLKTRKMHPMEPHLVGQFVFGKQAFNERLSQVHKLQERLDFVIFIIFALLFLMLFDIVPPWVVYICVFLDCFINVLWILTLDINILKLVFRSFDFWFLSGQGAAFMLLFADALGWDTRAVIFIYYVVGANLIWVADASTLPGVQDTNFAFVTLIAIFYILLGSGSYLNWFPDMSYRTFEVNGTVWNTQELLLSRVVVIIIWTLRYMWYAHTDKQSMVIIRGRYRQHLCPAPSSEQDSDQIIDVEAQK